jgi:hypothetical protein
MVAVQMADKDVVDTTGFDIVPQHLLLGAFAAIN